MEWVKIGNVLHSHPQEKREANVYESEGFLKGIPLSRFHLFLHVKIQMLKRSQKQTNPLIMIRPGAQALIQTFLNALIKLNVAVRWQFQYNKPHLQVEIYYH